MNNIFTVENTMTGSYRTFWLERNREGGLTLHRQKGRNEDGIVWQAIGFIRVKGNRTYVALHKWARNCGHLCDGYVAKYGQCVHTELRKMVEVLEVFDLTELETPQEAVELPSGAMLYKLIPASLCGKCGEVLTSPESIRKGVGPICGKFPPSRIGKVW